MWEKIETGSVKSLPECSQVLGISHGRAQSSRPSYIHIEAFSLTGTHLDGGREEERREKNKMISLIVKES